MVFFFFFSVRSPPSPRDLLWCRALDTARSPVAGCVCSAFIEMWSEEVKKSPVVVFRLGVFSGVCPRAVCSLFTLKALFHPREKPRLFERGKIASLGITDNSTQNRRPTTHRDLFVKMVKGATFCNQSADFFLMARTRILKTQ